MHAFSIIDQVHLCVFVVFAGSVLPPIRRAWHRPTIVNRIMLAMALWCLLRPAADAFGVDAGDPRNLHATINMVGVALAAAIAIFFAVDRLRARRSPR